MSEPRTVVLTDDLDVASAAEVEQQLLEAVESAGEYGVTVDVRGLLFCDSAGIRALVRSAEAASTAGRPFTLTQVPAPIRRVLEIAGVDKILGVLGAP